MSTSRGEDMLALLPKMSARSDGEESADEDEDDFFGTYFDPVEEITEEVLPVFEDFEVLDDNYSCISIDDVIDMAESRRRCMYFDDDISEGDLKIPQEPVRAPLQNVFVVRKKKKQISSKIFTWRKAAFKKRLSESKRKSLKVAPKTPTIKYFQRFFSEKLIDLIVYESNLYCSQKNNANPPIVFTKNDIYDFLAVLLISGVVRMRDYGDYWSTMLGFEKIQKTMSLEKFKMLRRYLHFYDNSNESENDRYHKIRPVVTLIRDAFREIPEEQRFSVDEMMVLYNGKKAGNRRQYVRNWGFKVFVRSGVSGIVYDFFIHDGPDTFADTLSEYEKSHFTFSDHAVLALCSSIQIKPHSMVFFDNKCTTPDLTCYLRSQYGILKGTRGAHSSSDKGSSSCRETAVSDHKKKRLSSSYKDLEIVSDIMGVDLSDMLISVYRTHLHPYKRWYMNIFAQLLDMSVNNSWLLYKRDNPGTKMKLYSFRLKLAECLLKHNC